MLIAIPRHSPWRCSVKQGSTQDAPALRRRRRRRFPFPKAHRRAILVVEDDTAIAEALVGFLEDEGFVAVRAGDGEQALSVLAGMQPYPGLILLDLMMPRMDGWRFRDLQLRDEGLRSIPVVVLSAHGASIAEQALMAPAAVLRKPCSADALLEVVQQHFRRFN